jgi:hypothetical protein
MSPLIWIQPALSGGLFLFWVQIAAPTSAACDYSFTNTKSHLRAVVREPLPEAASNCAETS